MSKQTPYQQGYQAFREGNLENPYNEDTSRARDWQFGFNQAYFRNLKYVQDREKGQWKAKKKAPVH